MRGGPFVPCRIWWERAAREPCDECGGDGHFGGEEPCYRCKGAGDLPVSDDWLLCDVDGKPADPYEQWLWVAKHPISEAEYWRLKGLDDFTEAPPAREAVDLNSLPPAGPPEKGTP